MSSPPANAVDGGDCSEEQLSPSKSDQIDQIANSDNSQQKQQSVSMISTAAKQQRMPVPDEREEGTRRVMSTKGRVLWSVITILCVAISTGYGSQVKYSLLNDNPAHFYPPYTMMWFNNSCLVCCARRKYKKKKKKRIIFFIFINFFSI